MKTQLLALTFTGLLGGSLSAQNINNPSFDSIYFGGIDRINHWVTSDGVGIHGFPGDTIPPLQANTFFDATGLQYSEILDAGVFIDTTPYSAFALQLKSQPNRYLQDGSHSESFVVNGEHFYTDNGGYIDFSKCGMPFTGKPTALKGYYKFVEQSATPNFGQCEILLKRYNTSTMKHDTIAYENEILTFSYSMNWQPFTIPINYVASTTPDSIVVIFKAAATPHLPTVFWVDDLSFEYGSIGLEEGEASPLAMYPNPVTDVLYFENSFDKAPNFKIFDLAGKIVLEGKCKSEINVASLKKGVYFIHLDQKKEHSSFKFIKQH